MELGFAQQSQAFLWSLLLGAALGAVYGVLKCVRFTFSTGSLATFLLDVCFMLFAALAVFLFSLGMIRGYVRVYVLLGTLAGLLAYRLTLGRLLFWLYRPIAHGCRRVRKKIFAKTELFLKKLLKNGHRLLYNVRGKE